MTKLVVVLIGVITLGGCGLSAAQRNATLTFANAAKQFGEASSKELVKMRNQTVAMNVALYRVPDLPKQYLPRNVPPIVVAHIGQCEKKGQPCEYKNLAGDFSGKWYETFVSGPLAMQAYGSALIDILGAQNKEQVKKSCDKLAAALRDIPGSPVTGTSAEAISDLSAQLTDILLADMKAHAIRAVVASTKRAVPTICRTVGGNFWLPSGNEIPKDNFAFRFQTTARNLATTSEMGIQLHPNDRLARSDSLAAFMLAQQNLNEARIAFPSIVKASDACVEAEAALIESLKGKSIGGKDIENFFALSEQGYVDVRHLGSSK